MTFRKAMQAISLFLLLAAGLAAQEILVTYQDGTVQTKSGSAWKNLSIGDRLSADSIVKLEKNAILEFQAGTSTMLISRAGTFNLKDILGANRKTEASGVAKTLQSSFSQLVGAAPIQKQGTVAGVRAANKSESSQLVWVTSDTQALLDTGTALLKSGRNAEALAKFREAQDEASDDEMPQVSYLMAYAQTLNGELRGALRLVDSVELPEDAPWAGDFVLLKARLLEQANAWPEAIEWLAGHGAALANDASRGQLYHFLLGLAYLSTGDKANADGSLNRAIGLGKDSELGKSAALLLQN